MGLCIALENETGQTVEMLTDEKNRLHSLLPSHDDSSSPMLAGIDWYGDTVFNNLQMDRFLSEWVRVKERAKDSGDDALIDGVQSLAARCKDGVHLYLKFIGD